MARLHAGAVKRNRFIKCHVFSKVNLLVWVINCNNPKVKIKNMADRLFNSDIGLAVG